MPMDGMLLIDKPAGMTSFGVVARVRRQLSQQAGKKVKVGHTGTLDPFATGLLILMVGSACKHAERFSKLDKTYEATMRLGATSTTGDPEGDITEMQDVAAPSEAQVQDVLQQFTGAITQTPPAYSAIKIDGQRAYTLARAGKAVDMPTRTVRIDTITLKDYTYPELTIHADVSSGTYIRTLVEDIGAALNTGAYCHTLRRTRVDTYDVAQALPLREGEDTISLSDIRPLPSTLQQTP